MLSPSTSARMSSRQYHCWPPWSQNSSTLDEEAAGEWVEAAHGDPARLRVPTSADGDGVGPGDGLQAP
jgi:hypothetical protein